MMIKNREERIKNDTLDATIKVLNIINHTANITTANWLKDEIKDPIKVSLSDFVDFVINTINVGWIEELVEFDYIKEFCDGKIDLDIKSLQEYLATIKDSLCQRVKH